MNQTRTFRLSLVLASLSGPALSTAPGTSLATEELWRLRHQSVRQHPADLRLRRLRKSDQRRGRPGRRWTVYRYHAESPVVFNESIRVTIEAVVQELGRKLSA